MRIAHYFIFLNVLLVSMAIAEGMDSMLLPTQNPATITFTEAINRALLENTGIKQIEQQRVIADSETVSSLSKHLPSVVGRASQTSSVKKGVAHQEDSANATLGITIPLLDAKVLLEIRQKRENAKAFGDKYRHEQESLISSVGDLYIEALIAQATKENAQEEYEHYQKSLSVLEKKIQVGSARPLDVTRAQYLASKAYSDLLEKSGEFRNRMGELGQKIGLREHFLLGEVNIVSPHLAKSRDELLLIANSAADVSFAEREIAQADFALLSEKFEIFPKFFATVDSGWQALYENTVLSTTVLQSTKMMINVELPLFTGFSSLAAIKSKRAAKTINEISLRAKNTEKILSINGILSQINDLTIVKQSAFVALDAALKAKESADRLFASGEATGLELVEANTNHFNAKNHVVTTSLRLEQAKLRLLFVIGRIKEIL